MTTSKFAAVARLLLLLPCVALLFSCEMELPDVGSIPDETPPQAAFSASANEGDFMTIEFTNNSISATDFVWDFGDGTTSTGRDPVHTYADTGAYEVTLTVSDKLEVSDMTQQTVRVEEPESDFEPEILNPGFDIEGDDSYRDGWRNGDLGGVIQITSSPIHTGEKAAKLPSAGDRIGYQAITVEPNRDYVLSFYYTLKTSNPGSITVAVLAGEVNDPAAIADATIASFTGSDQTSASDFVQATIEFNSGDNSTVAIYFTNEGEEGRIDTFEIEAVQ